MTLLETAQMQLAAAFVCGALFSLAALAIIKHLRKKMRHRRYDTFLATDYLISSNRQVESAVFSQRVFETSTDDMDIPAFLRRQTDDTAPHPTSQVIQQELSRLSTGIILFNPPPLATVGISERIEVRIAKKPILAILDNLKGRGARKTDEIKIADIMRVTLAGAAFLINARSTEEQLLIDDDYTEWSWDVVPRQSGAQTLRLTVAVVIAVPGFKERKELPVLEKNLLVRSNIRYAINEFGAKNWQWIAGTLLIPIAVFLWKTINS